MRACARLFGLFKSFGSVDDETRTSTGRRRAAPHRANHLSHEPYSLSHRTSVIKGESSKDSSTPYRTFSGPT